MVNLKACLDKQDKAETYKFLMSMDHGMLVNYHMHEIAFRENVNKALRPFLHERELGESDIEFLIRFLSELKTYGSNPF